MSKPMPSPENRELEIVLGSGDFEDKLHLSPESFNYILGHLEPVEQKMICGEEATGGGGVNKVPINLLHLAGGKLYDCRLCHTPNVEGGTYLTGWSKVRVLFPDLDVGHSVFFRWISIGHRFVLLRTTAPAPAPAI